MGENEREFSSWYYGIPRLTRFWFTACIILPFLGYFNIIRWTYLTLDLTMTFRHAQLWRLATTFVCFPIRQDTIMAYLLILYLLYHYSRKLESGANFVGRPAEYLFMLLFNGGCLIISGLYFGEGILMDPMVLSVVQVWCQLHRNVIVDFWFGTRFRAEYIPWLLFALEYLLGNWGWFALMGIAVGHLFYFLVYKYPQDKGCTSLLVPPAFLYHWLPNTRTIFISGKAQPADHQSSHSWALGQRDWGAGRRLAG